MVSSRQNGMHFMKLLIILPAFAAACDGNAKRAASPVDMPAVAPSKRAASIGSDEGMRANVPSPFVAQSPAANAAAPNMVIRNGSVTIQVASLDSAMAVVREVATKVGGYVGNVTMSTGEYQVRSATIQLKVPVARFDEAMSGMPSIGKVEHSTTTAEDVGEEFVDLTARMENAKRLETRLVTLLANRAGSLEDILAVERELARVRQEIERYEGRARYLSTRVATSTIDVTVHEPAPLLDRPGTNVMARAFVNMWRNFVQFIAWFIESLGILIPLGLIVWLLWILARRVKWRRAAQVKP